MITDYTNNTEPTRVGHRMKDDCDVYVGRAKGGKANMLNTPIGKDGWLGNPFTVPNRGRNQAIEDFRTIFEWRLKADDDFRDAVANLSGDVLGCWCQRVGKSRPDCHAEVIAEHADRLSQSKGKERNGSNGQQ